jgi:hypothetical protein
MDINRANLVKVANALEVLDKSAGLRRLYDKHLLNPIDSVFNTTKTFIPSTKVAMEVFTPEMADRITPDQVSSILGEDVLKESMSGKTLDRGALHAVINSLPNEMVQDFVSRIG